MNEQLVGELVRRLAPQGYTEPAKAEATYPPRRLPASALVTRLSPSPTGFVHIGTIYTALINERLAHQSGGVFYVRAEDTDKKREAAGGLELMLKALAEFKLPTDEGPLEGGAYGPYVQSQRAALYTGYAIGLLKGGRAYPAFETEAELEKLRNQQTTQKVRPGYYGQFAGWRNQSAEQIAAALAANQPFVLRFRSSGDHSKRIEFQDALKGKLSLPQNDLDIPLLKSDGLPTYHLAHIVDDHLMHTSLVIRGDEWLSSVPLHIDLATALGLTPFLYGHLAPISVLDQGKKRKLSKRKDQAADVGVWLDNGFPPPAILEYLLGLANSNFEDWRRDQPDKPLSDFRFSLKKLAASRAPLLDPKKLADVSRDAIARLPQADYDQQLLTWLKSHDPKLYQAMSADPTYTKRVLQIERTGEQARKDLASWREAADTYGYFYDAIYQAAATKALPTELAGIDFLVQKQAVDNFLASWQVSDDQPTWLQKFRAAAEQSGFSPDNKRFNDHPDQFKGSLADFAKIIRVRLTGRNRSPDLFAVMQIMGEQRVRSRLEL